MFKTIALAFDGVVTTSRNQAIFGNGRILDAPRPDIDSAIRAMRRGGYKVVLVSSRLKTKAGREGVSNYVEEHGIEFDGLSVEPPDDSIFVSDKAICFNGDVYDILTNVVRFTEWYNLDI